MNITKNKTKLESQADKQKKVIGSSILNYMMIVNDKNAREIERAKKATMLKK